MLIQRLIIAQCLLTVLLIITGCASFVTPSSDNKEEIALANNLIANAQKSIELAQNEGALDYSPNEFAQSKQLLEKADVSFKKRNARVAEDLAFLADTEAKISIAHSKEAKARIQTSKDNGEEIKLILETKIDETAGAKARQSIAEIMMQKAQQDSEKTRTYSDKEIQKARAELAIAKADLMINLADQVKASEYAKKNYTDSKAAIQKANTDLEAEKFQDSISDAEEAEKYASNAYIEAKAKIDSETSESAKAKDKTIRTIAKAELLVEQARENKLVRQYSSDVLDKAEKSLKDADLALKAGDYDRAESLAQETRLTASNAQAVAIAKERENTVKEINEDAKASALDVLAKLEKLISQANSAGAAEFASEDYKEAQSRFERAKQAMLKPDYEEVASLSREGITYSATALAIAEAKSKLKSKAEEIEKNIVDETSKIPETTAKKTNKGIVISMTGDIFTQGNKIKNESQDRIKKLAEILKKYPDYKFIIEGHTDDTGSDETNLKMSNERAYNFMRYLVDQEKIPMDMLSSVGYGESKPVIPNTDDNSRRQNRRIDILILY
jgi:outer membrane protein OmpA-like peptidoglycan-associated protein